MARRRGVRRRLARYRTMLELQRDWKSSPLDKAVLTFEANWLLCDAPMARLRLLVLAPLSSAARRLAGRLYPAARALTLCDTPP